MSNYYKKVLDYYKKVIERHKTELKMAYVTVIAYLIEQNENKLQRLGYIGDNKRIINTTIIWADEHHIIIDESEIMIEYIDEDGQVYERNFNFYELDNYILEYIYNVLSK